MKKNIAAWLVLVLVSVAGTLSAQEATNKIPAEVLQFVKNLKYEQGEIDLKNGLATLHVPKEFNYLGPDDAEKVLEMWGNPPSETKPLGMILPAGLTPLSTNCWVVTIEYSEEGYVKDDDASKINYNDLLKKMQQGVAENNAERQKHGYQAISLVGWAAPPHYDAVTHKLYWAKDLKFEGSDEDTLNYNIRMLGRKGVLELNAVAGIGQLAEIDQQTPQILRMVDFKQGNRYADFDPKSDKVAEYGIAALVAGGALAAAAKLGLLKGLWVLLAPLWKFIVIAFVAFGAAIKKLFAKIRGK